MSTVSAASAAPSWFRCQVQLASVPLCSSSMPCPKLGSLQSSTGYSVLLHFAESMQEHACWPSGPEMQSSCWCAFWCQPAYSLGETQHTAVGMQNRLQAWQPSRQEQQAAHL